MLDITNSTREVMIFHRTTIGILDLISLGYYKIKQGVLQQIGINIIILKKLIMYGRNLIKW